MSRANNKEKYKEYDHNYYIKHRRPKSKIGQAELKIANLEAKLAELNKEPLNCSQLENGMSLCVIQKSRIVELETKLAESQNTACKNIAELTKIATEKDRKIEELKQQLAEKEADLIALDTDNYSFKQQIDNLRQQLAEKDEEIEYYKTLLKRQCDECKHNRDKILFAVEKLEEVKEFANKVDGCEFDIDYVISYIDNQIKEIKGEK